MRLAISSLYRDEKLSRNLILQLSNFGCGNWLKINDEEDAIANHFRLFWRTIMSRRNEIGSIFLGILLLVGMHGAVFLLAGLILVIISLVPTPISSNYLWIPLVLYPTAGIGLFQVLYVVPVCLLLKRRGRFGLMKGVIIGAVLTALLNGGCWLFLYSARVR